MGEEFWTPGKETRGRKSYYTQETGSVEEMGDG